MVIKKAFQLFCLFVVCSGMQCREAADILESYHFTTLKPPSTLYFVGAIVAVEVDKDGNIETGSLKLCCGPRASLGSNFVALSSHTISESMRRSTRSTWKLDGELMAAIKSKASLDSVESVEVTLRNARIVTISDSDLLENLTNRSDDCKRAVAARLRAGHSLTMISSALVADMDYSVNFKESRNVDKKVRAKQMTDIAVTLGGGHTRLSERTIESRGLTLGIKTDSFLMALSVPEILDPDFEHHSKDEEDRTVPMSEASTSDEADAPLVLPGGGYVQPQFDGF